MQAARDWSEIFSGIPPPGSDSFVQMLAFCEVHEARVLATLPWLAAEIAGRDGFPLLFHILRLHGGSRMFVGHDYSAFISRSGMQVGESTFARMRSQANAAGCVEIPSAWGAFIALRRVAIVLALEAGDSPRVIAGCFGVTERSLRKLRYSNHELRNGSA